MLIRITRINVMFVFLFLTLIHYVCIVLLVVTLIPRPTCTYVLSLVLIKGIHSLLRNSVVVDASSIQIKPRGTQRGIVKSTMRH